VALLIEAQFSEHDSNGTGTDSMERKAIGEDHSRTVGQECLALYGILKSFTYLHGGRAPPRGTRPGGRVSGG
jgi:hypothetical protein